jgi:feruloyl esterase
MFPLQGRAAPLAAFVLLSARLAGGASCESLTTLVLPDTTITAARISAAGYCRVEGVVAPSIGFEVRLPDAWNGKFLGVGNGGFAGFINFFGMDLAVARGYATASTDTGHIGNPLDASWALGRPDLVEDFGHRAIHVTTITAKSIVAAYYGMPATRAYFLGCSTGGKQALTEAQRYPGDYDGIVAGAPANYFTHLSVASNWVSQAVHADPASVIPSTKLPAIAAAVLATCDARDGVADGLLADPRRCRFRPKSLRCAGAETDACLTDAQIVGLEQLYDGPRTSKGRKIYPGFPPGGELGSGTDAGPAGEPNLGGWETWIVGTMPGFAHAIQDSFFKFMVFEDPTWDWRSLDLDRDVRVTDAKLAAILNATDPDLRPFRDRGGKLVMFHGWSDPAISALNSIDYWTRVVRSMRGRRRTDAFLRLFLAPGMQHCAGGPGPNVFDAVGALERWVEERVAPDRIVGTHRTAGVVDRTRPLCPYPRVARWDGIGDSDDAASFECRR